MWSERNMVGFDTETTGINPLQDRIVTVSLIEVKDDQVIKHYWLANPGIEIPARATEVHGITTELAQSQGRPSKEVLSEVAEILTQYAKAECPLVAFNASFDFTLLEAELARHNLPTLKERLGNIAPVLDPFLLDKTYDKYRRGKRNLASVAQHYGVWDDDDFHNAEADVLATLRILGAILRKYPEIAHTDFTQLMQAQEATSLETSRYFQNLAQQRGEKYDNLVGWPIGEYVQ